MRSMGDNEVSLILTDPPYFTHGMGDDWDTHKLKQRIKPGVVGSIPAGMKFSPTQGRALQNFLTPIASQWLRILRPGGFCLVFSQNRLMHRCALALEETGFEIRDVLLWQYEGQAKAFSQNHFITKSQRSNTEKQRLIHKLAGRKTPQLKPSGELIVLAQAPKQGTFVDNWDQWETGLIDVASPYLHPEKFPSTLLRTPKPRARYGHLTPKPVPLLRHLIRIFSAPGSLVFDPFAGSGSTGVAAWHEDRDFLGFEIEAAMATLAQQRCTSAQSEAT